MKNINFIEEIWFWFCKGQLLRDSHCKFIKRNNQSVRPCQIDDIARIIIKLKFSGKISKKIIQILQKYGPKFCPPNPCIKEEKNDSNLWETGIYELKKECLKKKLLEKKAYHGKE